MKAAVHHSPAKVVEVSDMNVITIDKNDVSKFPLATATQMEAAAELKATGTVYFPTFRVKCPSSLSPTAASSTSRRASTTT